MKEAILLCLFSVWVTHRSIQCSMVLFSFMTLTPRCGERGVRCLFLVAGVVMISAVFCLARVLPGDEYLVYDALLLRDSSPVHRTLPYTPHLQHQIEPQFQGAGSECSPMFPVACSPRTVPSLVLAVVMETTSSLVVLQSTNSQSALSGYRWVVFPGCHCEQAGADAVFRKTFMCGRGQTARILVFYSKHQWYLSQENEDQAL